MKYETLAIHGGRGLEEGTRIRSVNYPIYLSSTFTQDSLDQFNEFMYTRSNNPTRNNLETLVAQLEGASHGLALSTGMAATSLVFSLIGPGEKVLINSNVYGGTWNFVTEVFRIRGIEFEIVEDFNNYDFAQADDSVTTVFLETPSNPLLEITDIRRVAEAAHRRGLRVIVDNTFMTSFYQKPLDLGADIVVYSATKYFAGHSDILAGLVLLNDDDVYAKLKFNQKTLGAVLDPVASYSLTKSIKTMPLRLKQHDRNAQAVAEYFKAADAADAVFYPGLPDHPGHDIHIGQASGNGAVLSVRLNEAYDMNTFCNSLRLFELAVSLGGVESLICHPGTMTHEEYPEELQEQIGITKNLLRLSVGIEDIEDIITDIDQALSRARR